VANRKDQKEMNLRLKITINGIVQGVGFRPFIYNLAKAMDLKGIVYNDNYGVIVEAEGPGEKLKRFLLKIETDKPERSSITGFEFVYLDLKGYEEFRISESRSGKDKTALISPDIAICKECIEEMYDPQNRRYLYPFINCTNCGPRYSIIEKLPYDRPNTSMKSFRMCEKCNSEYNDPCNRRFHAQPIACPDCGPEVVLTDNAKNNLALGIEAILKASEFIKSGKIIALKGLGGFQLLADALNDETVKKLRSRKNREEKPFALMLHDLSMVSEFCYLNDLEKRLLKSPEAPIVLLRKRINDQKKLADSVAPENPYLGVMLPYTPIHSLLMNYLTAPIIATSGNISDEPICIDNEEAYEKLHSIADYFLVHNRPIVRHVDDSIARVINDRELLLRRARGYAPMPVKISGRTEKIPVIAVGAHLKNCIAVGVQDNVILSQHIGDLSSYSAYQVFLKTIENLSAVYELSFPKFLCDMHPEYLSTKFVKSVSEDCNKIQHHFAHIASCKAENEIGGKLLGVAWDGTGYGLDGNVWGSEFFLADDKCYSHIAQFRNFQIPGGEKAIRESRRSALGLLFEIFGIDLFNNHKLLVDLGFSDVQMNVLRTVLTKRVNSFKTSSAGRLFDAVSSILGISQESNYEGQSAMKLEYAADYSEKGIYDFKIIENDILLVDWENMVLSIMDDKKSGVHVSKISSRFHNTLSRIILKLAEIFGEEKIVLSGGCFQNKYLAESAISLLEKNKFRVYTHQRIPPNDGGIALGQIAADEIYYKPFDYKEFNLDKNISLNFSRSEYVSCSSG
jgi:hydrogenase maturation protein HypF